MYGTITSRVVGARCFFLLFFLSFFLLFVWVYLLFTDWVAWVVWILSLQAVVAQLEPAVVPTAGDGNAGEEAVATTHMAYAEHFLVELALIAYSALTFFTVFGLFGYHATLILKNQVRIIPVPIRPSQHHTPIRRCEWRRESTRFPRGFIRLR